MRYLTRIPFQWTPFLDTVVIRCLRNVRVHFGQVEPLGDSCEWVNNLQNENANLNLGSMGPDIYLSISKSQYTITGNGFEPLDEEAKEGPITAIDVIFVDKYEQPRKGFTVVEGNVNKGSFGRTIHLCVERNPEKPPITGLIVIDPEIEVCPAEFIQVHKNLNSGALGRCYHLCYKVARTNNGIRRYPPSLLSRIPEQDHPRFSLPEDGIPHLCFPQRACIINQLVLPKYFSFVVTGETGREVYCGALLFYEPLSEAAREHILALNTDAADVSESVEDNDGENKSTGSLEQPLKNQGHKTGRKKSSKKKTRAERKRSSLGLDVLYAPKCVCLLSRWPLYDSFLAFLKQLYQISLSPSPLPIQDYINDFCFLTEYPMPGHPFVDYRLGHNSIILQQYSHCYVPPKDFSFLPLFENLSIENVVTLFSHILAERKIVLYSNNYSILCPIAEALRNLMFPLQWQFAFIPVLPSKLSYIVNAPVPLIVGMHRSFLDEVRVDHEVVLVDLDRNRIRIPQRSLRRQDSFASAHEAANPHSIGVTVPIPSDLFQDVCEQLRSCADVYRERDASLEIDDSLFVPKSARKLSMFGGDRSIDVTPYSDDDVSSTDDFDEGEIQDIFMRFFVYLFQNYRRFLGSVAQHDRSGRRIPFHTQNYVNSFPTEMREFMSQLTGNQAFHTFVVERAYPIEDEERALRLLFFDWCISIEKAKDLPRNYYMKLEDFLSGSELPHIAIEPLHHRRRKDKGDDALEQKFRYDTFPVLSDDMFWRSDEKEHLFPPPSPARGKRGTSGSSRQKANAMKSGSAPSNATDTDMRIPKTPSGDSNTDSHGEYTQEQCVSLIEKCILQAVELRRERKQKLQNSEVVTIVDESGFPWDEEAIVSVYEAWFMLFLDEWKFESHYNSPGVTQDEARSHLITALYELHTMIKRGVVMSRNTLLSFASFMCRFRLLFELQQLLCAASVFVNKGYDLGVDFFEKCAKMIHHDRYIQNPDRPALALKVRNPPASMLFFSRCDRCGYQPSGTDIADVLVCTQVDLDTPSSPTTALQAIVALLYKKTKKKKPTPAKPGKSAASSSEVGRAKNTDNKVQSPSAAKGVPPINTLLFPWAVEELMNSPRSSPRESGSISSSVCGRCHNSSVETRLLVSDRDEKKKNEGVQNDESPLATETTKVSLLSPVLLLSAFHGKRKAQELRATQRRLRALKALSEKNSDTVSSESNKPSPPSKPKPMSLKDLTVLDWVKYENSLFWNLYFFFTSQKLPVTQLLNLVQLQTPKSATTDAEDIVEPSYTGTAVSSGQWFFRREGDFNPHREAINLVHEETTGRDGGIPQSESLTSILSSTSAREEELPFYAKKLDILCRKFNDVNDDVGVCEALDEVLRLLQHPYNPQRGKLAEPLPAKESVDTKVGTHKGPLNVGSNPPLNLYHLGEDAQLILIGHPLLASLNTLLIRQLSRARTIMSRHQAPKNQGERSDIAVISVIIKTLRVMRVCSEVKQQHSVFRPVPVDLASPKTGSSNASGISTPVDCSHIVGTIHKLSRALSSCISMKVIVHNALVILHNIIAMHQSPQVPHVTSAIVEALTKHNIPSMVGKALKRHPDSKEVQMAACDLVGAMVTLHTSTVPLLQSCGVISSIVHTIVSSSSLRLKEAALNVVLSLLAGKSSQAVEALVDAGCIRAILDVCFKIAFSSSAEDSQHLVRLMSMALKALLEFCDNVDYVAILVDEGVIKACSALLNCPLVKPDVVHPLHLLIVSLLSALLSVPAGKTVARIVSLISVEESFARVLSSVGRSLKTNVEGLQSAACRGSSSDSPLPMMVSFDLIRSTTEFVLNLSGHTRVDVLISATRSPVPVLVSSYHFLSTLLQAHQMSPQDVCDVDGSRDERPSSLTIGRGSPFLFKNDAARSNLVLLSLFPAILPDMLSRAVVGMTNVLDALHFFIVRNTEDPILPGSSSAGTKGANSSAIGAATGSGVSGRPSSGRATGSTKISSAGGAGDPSSRTFKSALFRRSSLRISRSFSGSHSSLKDLVDMSDDGDSEERSSFADTVVKYITTSHDHVAIFASVVEQLPVSRPSTPRSPSPAVDQSLFPSIVFNTSESASVSSSLIKKLSRSVAFFRSKLQGYIPLNVEGGLAPGSDPDDGSPEYMSAAGGRIPREPSTESLSGISTTSESSVGELVHARFSSPWSKIDLKRVLTLAQHGNTGLRGNSPSGPSSMKRSPSALLIDVEDDHGTPIVLSADYDKGESSPSSDDEALMRNALEVQAEKSRSNKSDSKEQEDTDGSQPPRSPVKLLSPKDMYADQLSHLRSKSVEIWHDNKITTATGSGSDTTAEELSQKNLNTAKRQGIPIVPSASDEEFVRQQENEPLVERWEKVLARVDATIDPEAALKNDVEAQELVGNGIPPEVRSKVWGLLTGAKSRRDSYPIDYYDQLVNRYMKHGSDYKYEIFQDLHRTLPNVPMFQDPDGQAALERVLGAYSLMDPDVIGYCQSMNVLCGALLLYLEEEDAFWVLTAIVKMHVGYYTKTMCSLMVDQRVLEDLFSFSQPSLHDHMLKYDVRISMFSVSWFLCMFVESPISINISTLFWDHLFFFGDEVMFRMALAIVNSKSEKIHSLNNIGDMLDFCLHGGVRHHLGVRRLLKRIHSDIVKEKEQFKGPSSKKATAHQPFATRLESLRQYHQSQVLMENRTVDASFASSLIQRFRFSDEMEIQRMWVHFLSPDPWKILQEASISCELHFHQAFFPFVYKESHLALWRDHGLFTGVTMRLFEVLDQHNSGRVSLIDYLRGISILLKCPIEERQKLCFTFFDLTGNGVVSRREAAKGMTMLLTMFTGRREQMETQAYSLVRSYFEMGDCVLEDNLTLHTFITVMCGDPYIRLFFRLGTDKELDEMASRMSPHF